MYSGCVLINYIRNTTTVSLTFKGKASAEEDNDIHISVTFLAHYSVVTKSALVDIGETCGMKYVQLLGPHHCETYVSRLDEMLEVVLVGISAYCDWA